MTDFSNSFLNLSSHFEHSAASTEQGSAWFWELQGAQNDALGAKNEALGLWGYKLITALGTQTRALQGIF